MQGTIFYEASTTSEYDFTEALNFYKMFIVRILHDLHMQHSNILQLIIREV